MLPELELPVFVVVVAELVLECEPEFEPAPDPDPEPPELLVALQYDINCFAKKKKGGSEFSQIYKSAGNTLMGR